jgi:hypothetical protein
MQKSSSENGEEIWAFDCLNIAVFEKTALLFRG